jgi:hypothetical protein
MDGETRVGHETSDTKAAARSSKEGEGFKEERTRAFSKRHTAAKNHRKIETGTSYSILIIKINDNFL